MSFDHLPEYEKLANVSDLITKGWGRAKIDAEIAKCEIVCLLCHADRTQYRRGLSANGNTPALHAGIEGSTPSGSTHTGFESL